MFVKKPALSGRFFYQGLYIAFQLPATSLLSKAAVLLSSQTHDQQITTPRKLLRATLLFLCVFTLHLSLKVLST